MEIRSILDKKNKKGALAQLLTIVIVILAVSALGATIFGADGLAAPNFTDNAPVWVVTLLTVGVGIALIRLVIRG